MTDKAEPELPHGMRRLYRRFERWRSSHQNRLPIPAALWASAAAAAREHGVFFTAKILRLEYAKLKRLAESAAPVRRRVASPAEFLELVAPPMAPPGSGLSECVIELEGPRGKMRVQWKGVTPPDLAGLSRSLWESA
jgi:transposase-like protein